MTGPVRTEYADPSSKVSGSFGMGDRESKERSDDALASGMTAHSEVEEGCLLTQ